MPSMHGIFSYFCSEQLQKQLNVDKFSENTLMVKCVASIEQLSILFHSDMCMFRASLDVLIVVLAIEVNQTESM